MLSKEELESHEQKLITKKLQEQTPRSLIIMALSRCTSAAQEITTLPKVMWERALHECEVGGDQHKDSQEIIQATLDYINNCTEIATRQTSQIVSAHNRPLNGAN